jgi:hypothetical protein
MQPTIDNITGIVNGFEEVKKISQDHSQIFRSPWNMKEKRQTPSPFSVNLETRVCLSDFKTDFFVDDFVRGSSQNFPFLPGGFKTTE